MSFVIGISHLASEPKRVACVKKLLKYFAYDHVYVEDKPGTCREWSQRLWEGTLALAEADHETHCLFLQDDVVLAPNFAWQIEDMIYAFPDEVISLHTNHQYFQELYIQGENWAISMDGLTGNGYVMSTKLLREFLDFQANYMRPEAIERYNEDARINLWCMATRRYIFHPMPSPIDHDLSILSTCGRDNDRNRRPRVPFWAHPVPETWDSSSVGVLGLVYDQEHFRLRTHLTKEGVEKFDVIPQMYKLESCAHRSEEEFMPEQRKAFHSRRRVSEIYNREFFDTFDDEEAEHEYIANALNKLPLRFSTPWGWREGRLGERARVVDIGCGPAQTLKYLRRLGWFVQGIEGSEYGIAKADPEVRELIRKQDITLGGDVPEADLVICTEVAEHLPERHANTLVDMIDQALSDQGLVFWTAATVGQGGHDHINEQNPPYWEDKFAARGIVVDGPLTRQFLDNIRGKVVKSMQWIYPNARILRRA